MNVISLPYIFQVLYVLSFTRPRYQVSVYRTIGPLVTYAKTKTQISFAVTAKLISAFVFATRIVQSLYFLITKSSVAVEPGLCRTWSETPKTGFLTTRLEFFFRISPRREWLLYNTIICNYCSPDDWLCPVYHFTCAASARQSTAKTRKIHVCVYCHSILDEQLHWKTRLFW